jgi:hypothetical protein
VLARISGGKGMSVSQRSNTTALTGISEPVTNDFYHRR